MARTRTLFVIGAGASFEAGLPLGVDLKSAISDMLDIRFNGYELTHGDSDVVDALRMHVKQPDGQKGDINGYVHAARQIASGMPLSLSIDNFLDGHRGNKEMELCGKIAITLSILRAEKLSKLYFNPVKHERSDFGPIGAAWYLKLWQLISEGVAKDELERLGKDIAFIIFNYDRCVEHFLIRAAQIYYSIGQQDARDLISKIPFYHPYGKVGGLPSFAGESDGVDFGEQLCGRRILQVASQVRTFTERIEDQNFQSEVHKQVASAGRIVFLGFAFHKQNMELIAPPTKAAATEVFATTFGVSESDRRVIDGQIVSLCRGRPRRGVETVAATCSAFFDHYWRSLSLV